MASTRCLDGSSQQAPSLLFPRGPHACESRGVGWVGLGWEGTARRRGPRGQESQTLGTTALATTNRPQPAPPHVIPTSGARAARSGPRFPGGADPGCCREAAPPYLGATGPHLVWRLFGHAAADPGHARHLAAAVHGPRRSDASRYRLGPGGSGNPLRPSARKLRESLPAPA